MSHTTRCLPRRCRTGRELEVRRRGPSPVHALQVEVRHEAIPPGREDQLMRAAVLQRLEQLRAKLGILRGLHRRAAPGDLEGLC